MAVDEGIKRKRRRRRFIVYGTLTAAFWGFWVWQPWEFDLFPRAAPVPHPKVQPNLERLFAKGTKVLIVTSHPDDSEFYVGGTLAMLRDSGAEIWQVIVTNGDKAYYGPLTDVAKNREVRTVEALDASRSWGAKNLVILGYPDGRLSVDQGMVKRLRTEIDKFQPEYVLSFDHDYPPRFSHRDHRRAGEAVALALQEPSSVRWLMRFSTSQPNFVTDISEYWPEKEGMLKIHKSQFYGKRLEGVTNMVQSRAMEDGEIIGAEYGEGFRALQLRSD